jgi:hypothetical protein
MVEVSSEESFLEDRDFDILTSDRFFEQMQVAFQTIGNGNLYKNRTGAGLQQSLTAPLKIK